MSKKSYVNMRIDADIRQWLDAIAEENRETISAVVRKIILKAFQESREGGGDNSQTPKPPLSSARVGARAVKSGERKCRLGDAAHCPPKVKAS